jgi:hypothetical protein
MGKRTANRERLKHNNLFFFLFEWVGKVKMGKETERISRKFQKRLTISSADAFLLRRALQCYQEQIKDKTLLEAIADLDKRISELEKRYPSFSVLGDSQGNSG